MHTTKKKPNVVIIVAGAILSAMIGYLVAGAWGEGMQVTVFMERLQAVFQEPFKNYYNAFTIRGIVVALVIYAMMLLMYYTNQRNYMPGKEYGTSKLAGVKQVNAILADKEDSNNRIFSQNVRMSLNTRHTKLNNNVLVIGGSGDCGIIVTGRTNPVKSRVCEA